MRPMRRGHYQVADLATLRRWLDEAAVGRLATIDENGYPVVKPVNFIYSVGKIYFHSASEGEKLDDIRRDDRVGFEIDKIFSLIPPSAIGCQGHCFFQSIVIRGRARILDNSLERAAKERVFRLLVGKYTPAYEHLPLTNIDRTTVVEITIEHITGKEDFGQRWAPERKLEVARALLERDGRVAEDVIVRMGLTLAEVVGDESGRDR